jgi:hypothetical protein
LVSEAELLDRFRAKRALGLDPWGGYRFAYGKTRQITKAKVPRGSFRKNTSEPAQIRIKMGLPNNGPHLIRI